MRSKKITETKRYDAPLPIAAKHEIHTNQANHNAQKVSSASASKSKLIVNIPAPSKLQYIENKWIVINAEGQGEILDHLEKNEFSIPIQADEKLLDCAVNNQDLICLTNLRMLVVQFE